MSQPYKIRYTANIFILFFDNLCPFTLRTQQKHFRRKLINSRFYNIFLFLNLPDTLPENRNTILISTDVMSTGYFSALIRAPYRTEEQINCLPATYFVKARKGKWVIEFCNVSPGFLAPPPNLFLMQ